MKIAALAATTAGLGILTGNVSKANADTVASSSTNPDKVQQKSGQETASVQDAQKAPDQQTDQSQSTDFKTPTDLYLNSQADKSSENKDSATSAASSEVSSDTASSDSTAGSQAASAAPQSQAAQPSEKSAASLSTAPAASQQIAVSQASAASQVQTASQAPAEQASQTPASTAPASQAPAAVQKADQTTTKPAPAASAAGSNNNGQVQAEKDDKVQVTASAPATDDKNTDIKTEQAQAAPSSKTAVAEQKTAVKSVQSSAVPKAAVNIKTLSLKTNAAQSSDQNQQIGQIQNFNQQNFAGYQSSFLNAILPTVINGWKNYQILPSLAVAQAALESGWGQSALASVYHNLFGIKGSYKGMSVNMATREVYNDTNYYINDNFRVYPSFAESLGDYYNFLLVNPRYHNLIGVTDAYRAAALIRQDGYATDPNYTNALVHMIDTYSLQNWDRVAFSQPIVVVNPSKPAGNNGSSSQDAAGQSDVYYIVQSGDTLWGIGSQYNTSPIQIAAWNNITNPNLIYVGQNLLVQKAAGSNSSSNNQSGDSSSDNDFDQISYKPGNGSNNSSNDKPAANNSAYSVKSGDNLTQIARAHGISLDRLVQLNHISNPNLIYVGQSLIFDDKSSDNGSAPKQSSSTGQSNNKGQNSAYKVQAGDTLTAIAARYGISVSQLAQANSISDPNLILVGQTINLPGGRQGSASTVSGNRSSSSSARGSYVIQSGDTLSSLAAAHGISLSQLVAINHVADPNLIYPGQEIKFS